MLRRILITVTCLASLNACSKSSAATTPPASAALEVVADEHGFTPSQVTLPVGSPGKIRFTRKSDKTCATEVVFPELGLRKVLPLDQAVEIEIPTSAARTLSFTCGMGMYKSQIVVR